MHEERPVSAARRCRRTPPTALLCLLLGACADAAPPESPPEPTEPGSAVAAEPPETAPEAALRRFLPDAMQRSTRPESFPHDAHGEIGCAVCHETPPGHSSHADVACAECHRASAGASAGALTPADCQSCHHSPEQALSCEACHESRPALTSVQQLDLEVWEAPRARPLDFDHARHGDVSCESCHQALPALTPAESCASCHTEHHVVDAECSACHVEPPDGAHDVQAHLTCSGSGCHRAPEVEAFATARSVCLVCHVEQVDHEPGGDCIQCHRVRGDPTAWAAWRHP